MPDDRRELLELLAYGRDPDVRPADRLRALELLEVMAGTEDVAVAIARELEHLPDEAIAELADAAQADIVGRIIRGDGATIALYPATAAVVFDASTRRDARRR
jgi:hypothetical protein